MLVPIASSSVETSDTPPLGSFGGDGACSLGRAFSKFSSRNRRILTLVGVAAWILRVQQETKTRSTPNLVALLCTFDPEFDL